MIVPDLVVVAVLRPSILLPGGDATSLMLFRWIHFLAGITWIGLLYFFNLVNVPFMKEMDAATKGKIVPSMMPRANTRKRSSASNAIMRRRSACSA